MRLIDADAFENYVFDEWSKNEISNSDWITFREWLKDQESVIEFDGDITKVVVRGEEYEKDIIQKFHDYQVEWLTSHCDLELEPVLESWVVRFLHDTANCYMMEVEHE